MRAISIHVRIHMKRIFTRKNFFRIAIDYKIWWIFMASFFTFCFVSKKKFFFPLLFHSFRPYNVASALYNTCWFAICFVLLMCVGAVVVLYLMRIFKHRYFIAYTIIRMGSVSLLLRWQCGVVTIRMMIRMNDFFIVDAFQMAAQYGLGASIQFSFGFFNFAEAK